IHRVLVDLATSNHPVTPFKDLSCDIRGLTIANACAVERRNPWLAEYHAHQRTTVMQIEASKKLFNVDDYYRMAEVGILGPYDRDVKLPRYAAAGVPEVWIMDLKENRLLVYRDPEKSAFQTNLILKSGESVFVKAFPEITFAIDELLG